MAAESGYLQLLGAFWEWVQKDTGLWLRAVGSLRDVLAERELESNETLMESLRLSAFSILIAIIMDVAAEAVFTSHPFSMIYGISLVVVYYISTLAMAIAIKLTSVLIVSVQPMRKCLVIALFTTVYWPLNNLGQFIIYDDKNMTVGMFSGKLSHDMSRSSFDLAVFELFVLVVGIFIFAKMVSAMKYALRVGLVRAVIAVVGVAAIFGLFVFGPMLPLYRAILKQIFGA